MRIYTRIRVFCVRVIIITQTLTNIYNTTVKVLIILCTQFASCCGSIRRFDAQNRIFDAVCIRHHYNNYYVPFTCYYY